MGVRLDFLIVVCLLLQITSSTAWLSGNNRIFEQSKRKLSRRMTPTTTALFRSEIDHLLESSSSSSSSEQKMTILPRRNLFTKTLQAGCAFLLPEAAFGSTTTEQRCDPSDYRCTQDGSLEVPTGKPIPRVTNKITYVVQMIVDIGERREEAGFIRFGLYGDDCPESTKQMLQFLTRGITSMNKDVVENSIGIQSAPVSLLEGGAVPTICSGRAVEFGVPSQAKSYAKSRGLRQAGPTFVPQQRPPPLTNEPFPRQHNVAGLVSIPAKGIGYGGSSSGTIPDDEAYGNAFLITADEAPSLDKMGRRVIGQVIDNKSMTFLARLSTLPVQKGIGMIPGQVSGPPLLRVRIRDVGVQKVK